MTQNTENEKEVKTSSFFDKKFDAAVESFGNGVEDFANKLGNKIDNLDEKDIENFFVNIGKVFVNVVKSFFVFFAVTIPKIAQKIKKLVESDGWWFLAPFLLIIIGLIILVAISGGIRNLFS